MKRYIKAYDWETDYYDSLEEPSLEREKEAKIAGDPNTPLAQLEEIFNHSPYSESIENALNNINKRIDITTLSKSYIENRFKRISSGYCGTYKLGYNISPADATKIYPNCATPLTDSTQLPFQEDCYVLGYSEKNKCFYIFKCYRSYASHGYSSSDEEQVFVKGAVQYYMILNGINDGIYYKRKERYYPLYLVN